MCTHGWEPLRKNKGIHFYRKATVFLWHYFLVKIEVKSVGKCLSFLATLKGFYNFQASWILSFYHHHSSWEADGGSHLRILVVVMQLCEEPIQRSLDLDEGSRPIVQPSWSLGSPAGPVAGHGAPAASVSEPLLPGAQVTQLPNTCSDAPLSQSLFSLHFRIIF